MPLSCRLQALNVKLLCDYHSLKAWALEGASIAVSLGRGGGCTHTHTEVFTILVPSVC